MTGAFLTALDFINETFLPWLEEEITSEAKGNKHYIRSVEDSMKALARFIEQHRNEWNVPDRRIILSNYDRARNCEMKNTVSS